MNVQATSCKKFFQMTAFCLIFQLGHKKRGAVTSPALITDRAGKPITCCGERIVASDDDKPSCKHSQVRHGNPVTEWYYAKTEQKMQKKQQPNNSRIATCLFKARSRLFPQQYRAFVKSMAHEYSSPRETTKTP